MGCIKETGESKLFSANITADDPAEMIARGKYVLSQFGPLGENTAFLVDGYVSGGTAITVARCNFPQQFLHYHRAGHGAVTSPQTQRGYTAFVHTKLSRIIGASGIHVGTMSFGKMEGDASDKLIAYMLQDDEAQGPYYKQEWEGLPSPWLAATSHSSSCITTVLAMVPSLAHRHSGDIQHLCTPKSPASSAQAASTWEP